ncbi:hypothetical protein MSAN_02046500 [Mycena sanguinolenta]|uniref:Uncharacterized protein n=1 Tax=Mycena sanguinolenta TaxID=230812 RepID=A0A8H7CNM6_9AGAR|nr:hypothetical protein MSAN_02046500 [Mycena sanguinolenta]
MALPSLGLLFLSALVSAQNSTSLGNVSVSVPAGNTISAGDFITFEYEYEGAVFQTLRNITAELLDSNMNVVDLMSDHGNDVGAPISTDIGYWTSAATPPGNYQIRVNGTVYNTTTALGNDPGTPEGPISALSKSWILSQPAPFACTTPTFTPVVSVSDPNYSPLQLGEPLAGTVYWLSNISTVGTITVAPSFIDESFFGGTNIPQMTMEVVKSPSLESVGSVVLNSTSQAYVGLPIDRFQLSAGAFKIRANFTDKNHAGNFTALSDEFYIASSGPCVGLQSGTSTTGGGSSSNNSSGSGTTGKTGAALSGKAVPVGGLCVLLLSLVAGAVAVLA